MRAGAGRPYVLIGIATGIDGRLTSDSGKVDFTSRDDRKRLHRLRAGCDAVMAGAGTIRAEDPPLGLPPFKPTARSRKEPLRIVPTVSGAIPTTARFLHESRRRALILAPRALPAARLRLLGAVADVEVLPGRSVDWPSALGRLRKRYGVRRLLLEGGNNLCEQFLEAGLVDEIHWTICPVLLGARQPAWLGSLRPGIRVPRFDLARAIRSSGEITLVYEAAASMTSGRTN